MQSECAFLSRSKVEQIAWAAGFFEGEGCFLYRPVGGERNGYQRRAILVNTDLEALRNFHAAVGMGYIKPVKTYKAKPHWKPRWQWHCCRRADLEALIAMFAPYLSSRRLEKANSILSNPARKVGGVFMDRCKQGHIRTPENTYIHLKSGIRQCRICNKKRALAHYHSHKEYWHQKYLERRAREKGETICSGS